MGIFSHYAAKAAPTVNDKLLIDDVADPSTVTGMEKVITIGQLGAAYNIVFPSGDPSGVTDTAAINALTQAGKAANLRDGSTYHVGNLLPDTNGTITGAGPSTVLQAVTGTTGYMVALKTPSTTINVVIKNLTLDGHSVSGLGGINLDNTGYVPVGNNAVNHLLEWVSVENTGSDAFHFDNNARGISARNCSAYNVTGYGYYLGPGAGAGGKGCNDSEFVNCVSSLTTNHGWSVTGGSWNNTFISCGAYVAGYGATSTKCGFEIVGQFNDFTGCRAQQNDLHGFDLQSCVSCSVVGCETDGNGAGPGVTTGAGINVNGAQGCTITGNMGGNNPFATATQAYGLQIANNLTGTNLIGNAIGGFTSANNNVGFSAFGHLQVDATAGDFGNSSFFKIPSPVLSVASPQALSNGTTITVSGSAALPVTATGNVTGIILHTPPNGWQQVTVINQSAFTVTFDVAGTSHVADGVSDVIPALTARTFVYDSNTNLWYRSA